MKMRLCLVVLLGLCAAKVGAQSIENPATGNLYVLLSPGFWDEQKAKADSMGGHLVTINDQAENDWIVANFPIPFFYIGYTDEVEEGTFVWLNGETPGYENWQTGEPNDSGGNEDVTLIFPLPFETFSWPAGIWADNTGQAGDFFDGGSLPALMEMPLGFRFTQVVGTFTVEEGSPISFSVEAVSPDSMSITYQWYKNDLAVGSATSSTYTPTASAAPGDDGDEYYVIADDGLTTIQSGTFLIRVVAVDALPAAGLVALLVLCALMSAVAVFTLRRKRAI